ncbi:MAG: CHRD domain-containing protein [Colwellia sp.]|nr:CHRD domain-containing protein [Colwellia sp.]
MFANKVWLPHFFVLVLLLACGGGGDSSPTPTPPTPPPPPPPPVTLTVTTSVTATEVIIGGAETGSATATLILNLDDNSLTGIVTLDGISADSVTLNQGYAGDDGDILLSFVADTATSWSLPTDSMQPSEMQTMLNKGELYLKVNNAVSGSLRGQMIIGNIQLIFMPLSGDQAVPVITTMASAKAAITLNPDDGAMVVHLNTEGISDATASHIHQALAGLTGGVIFELQQDANDSTHWSTSGGAFDNMQMQSFNRGEFYLNLHTATVASGELRGQIIPTSVDLSFTLLDGNQVVPEVVTDNSGTLAMTIQIASKVIDMHVNLVGLTDATGITINQAPMGQNGPIALTLMQDSSNEMHWLLENITLTDSQYAALFNQGLYLNVASAMAMSGELRGQLKPEMSSAVGDGTFVMTMITPENGAMLTTFPASIEIIFNQSLLSASVSLERVSLLAAGGDNSFNDGNEVVLSPVNIMVSTDTMTIDLSGASNGDDEYQLTLDGSSTMPITDSNGVVLDGDNDDNAGGDLVSTFTVTTPMQVTTLTQLKTQIFSPNCAVSGCHAGASPQQGMNLSASQIFSNIVNVTSSEAPNLMRVTPGDPDNSYLIQKVEGTASVGARMPLGQAALTNAEIDMIRQWILDGAQDN